MIRIVMDVFFALGIFFIFAGIVGMFRMPDTFCRLQSSTNIVTMGGLSILVGTIIFGFYSGNSSIAIKSIVMGIFILLTNPVASHAMTRAAYKSGANMDKKSVCDHYGRDKLNE